MTQTTSCPICLEIGTEIQDESEQWHFHCEFCGFDTHADGMPNAPHNHAVKRRLEHSETEQCLREAEADAIHAQFDNDPNPYEGTYSEE